MPGSLPDSSFINCASVSIYTNIFPSFIHVKVFYITGNFNFFIHVIIIKLIIRILYKTNNYLQLFLLTQYTDITINFYGIALVLF